MMIMFAIGAIGRKHMENHSLSTFLAVLCSSHWSIEAADAVFCFARVFALLAQRAVLSKTATFTNREVQRVDHAARFQIPESMLETSSNQLNTILHLTLLYHK